MKVIAFIPARGGSKGIKGKNLRKLSGKHLIDFTIQAAVKSKYVDYVFVSTDSIKIANAAKLSGADVPFLRPVEIATDTSTISEAIDYGLRELEKVGKIFDVVVLLQPTSPLRLSSDIDEAIELFVSKNCQALCSVNPVEDHPILIRKIDANSQVTKLIDTRSSIRRQDMPIYYKVNGAIYIALTKGITAETSFNDSPVAYIMPTSRSIDIDEPIDLKIAKLLLKKQN